WTLLAATSPRREPTGTAQRTSSRSVSRGVAQRLAVASSSTAANWTRAAGDPAGRSATATAIHSAPDTAEPGAVSAAVPEAIKYETRAPGSGFTENEPEFEAEPEPERTRATRSGNASPTIRPPAMPWPAADRGLSADSM